MHLGVVGELADLAARTRGVDVAHQVVVVAEVDIVDQVDAVVEETEVETHVELLLLLVGELRVAKLIECDTRLLLVALRAPNILRGEDGRGVGGCGLVAHERVAGAQRGVGEPIVVGCGPVLEPLLLMGVPAGTDVPGGQPAAAAVLAHVVVAVIAARDVQSVDTLIRVVEVGEVSKTTGELLAEAVERGAALLGLLVELVGQGLNAVVLVVDTIDVVLTSVVVGTVGLHTHEGVEDVGVGPNVVVLHSATEVELLHAVHVHNVDTACGHHRHGQCVLHVGIGVEERVVVHHVGVVHTGAVGLGLVGVVLNDVLTRCLVEAVVAQEVDLKSHDGFDVELTREAQVVGVDLDHIVVQLREDVERSVVARIGGVGVQRARGVHGVAEGVDVEVAVHGAVHHVDILAERTRSVLVAVAHVTAHGHGDCLAQFVGSVEVARIALHLAVLVPSRVEHGRHRSIEAGTVGTAGDAHRVVLHDVVVEEQVEPVGVAELGLLQVGVHGSLRVGQTKLAVALVILFDERVHLAVETRCGAVGKAGILEPTLGLHLLVDTHLLLGVGDVVVAVAGLEAISELTRIIDGRVSRAAFLGGDDHHTSHGARTIYRGGGTILQDLEALDIVGVESGDGIGNQRCGITRREVICAHVDGILKNHAVDHPQRA